MATDSPVEERLRLAVGDASAGWLATYLTSLRRDGRDEVGIAVTLADSVFIADRACPPPEDARWSSSRLRTGAVMGAVQSGKTASMLGVLARALDEGVNVVVVLAGTRRALWLQTLQRLRRQLDYRSGAFRRRTFVPNPKLLEDDVHAGLEDLYVANRVGITKTLKAGRPVIIVAMKQADHLQRLSQVMHDVIYPAAFEADLKSRVLVLDDEADDASVEDANGKFGDDAVRWIPTRIRDLWASRRNPNETASPNIFATYIGYTATPQANFLQDPQNPLAPRDFVASLRVPGSDGSLEPRALTYRADGGLRAWYTGSDIFYGPLVKHLCVVLDPGHDRAAEGEQPREHDEPEQSELEQLVEGVRAYLVAAAVRLARQPRKLGPASATAQGFDDLATAEHALAQPSCMLVHPSSATTEHFAVADLLRTWWHDSDSDQTFRGAGVLRDLAQNEEAWRRWRESYLLSRDATVAAYDLTEPGSARDVPDWATLRALIEDELVPATRIAVINSDPSADDRPSFEPRYDGTRWCAPIDHSTIFVSGNVMARGLTLEGLLTTVFTRAARAPLADSQMQMQRWFGYRGEYIDLCRVLMSARQVDLFVKYAEADYALRRVVMHAMSTANDLPTPTVLQGGDFRATGKIRALSSVPLSPGRRPFISRLNPPGRDDSNLRLVADFFQDEQRNGHAVGNKRGIVTRRALPLLEAAALLDGMRYDEHRTSRDEQERWKALEARLDLTPADDEFPLLRDPAVLSDSDDMLAPSPFAIAAYFRFWSACLVRRVVGLATDEEPPQKWSLLNLEAKRDAQPMFRVGLRLGSGQVIDQGPIVELERLIRDPLRAMDRAVEQSRLTATWGSRGASANGYMGDDLFDFQILGETPRLEADGSRSAGSTGFILFHLIDRGDARGGMAVGLSIPAGGPQHIEARNATRAGAVR